MNKNTTLLKSSTEWLEDFETRNEGFKMLDPDGWRFPEFSWNTPITQKEFITRLGKCTSQFTESALNEMSEVMNS